MQVSFYKFVIKTANNIQTFPNRRGYVPDIILSTVELPEDLAVVGTGTLIQACVSRPKRDLRSEHNAREISDGLPFLGEKNKSIKCWITITSNFIFSNQNMSSIAFSSTNSK